MKNKKIKPVPKFVNEKDEKKFWEKADTSEYFDLNNPIEMDLSKLKPSTESISLRLPSHMLGRIKELANAQDVPYQSLMKTYLARQISSESRLKNAGR